MMKLVNLVIIISVSVLAAVGLVVLVLMMKKNSDIKAMKKKMLDAAKTDNTEEAIEIRNNCKLEKFTDCVVDKMVKKFGFRKSKKYIINEDDVISDSEFFELIGQCKQKYCTVPGSLNVSSLFR